MVSSMLATASMGLILFTVDAVLISQGPLKVAYRQAVRISCYSRSKLTLDTTDKKIM
jgi:hypothetical protein